MNKEGLGLQNTSQNGLLNEGCQGAKKKPSVSTSHGVGHVEGKETYQGVKCQGIILSSKFFLFLGGGGGHLIAGQVFP